MGWTYVVAAYKPGITPQFSDLCDYARDGVTLLTDDMVFDREALRGWMGLSESDVTKEDSELYAVSLEHVDRALDVLNKLHNKVREMPYDPDPDNKTGFYLESLKPGAKMVYHGTPNNIAIYKEVEKVLARPYHFNFPWMVDRWKKEGKIQDPREAWGVPYMLSALAKIRRYMVEHPEEKVVVGTY